MPPPRVVRKRRRAGMNNSPGPPDVVKWDPKDLRDINDTVYDRIIVPWPVSAIIDTPEFQRLRTILQLGFTSRVYPSANHSRFEHSLGVCHLAGELANLLRDKQPELDITDVDVMCVQIAGLCHDLGHGPYSHFFDNLFMAQVRPERAWRHEEASVLMFDHLLNSNPSVKQALDVYLKEEDYKFIKEIITGPPKSNGDPEEWPYAGREREKGFLYDIVSNKHDGLDVDRFDYFLRDSKHAVNVLFDMKTCKRLFDMARVMEFQGHKRICYSVKVLNDLLSVGHTRYHLHHLLYQHKTTLAIELVMLQVFTLADKHITFRTDAGEDLSISKSVDDMSAYSQLDGAVLPLVTRGARSGEIPDLQEAARLITMVDRRQLPKSVGHTVADPNSAHRPGRNQQLAQEMLRHQKAQNLTIDDIYVFVVRMHHGMDKVNPMERVVVYDHKNLKLPPYLIAAMDEFEPELPRKFAVCHIYVYCRWCEDKKQQAKLQDEVYHCFEKWCKDQSITPLKRPQPPLAVTPEKSPEPKKYRQALYFC